MGDARSRGRLRSLIDAAWFFAAYLVLGWLGVRLALPPGNVTPVWPASGLAFGVLLIRGTRVWPGMFLASWVCNIMSLSPAARPVQAVVAGLGVAAATTLQAVWGASLIARLGPSVLSGPKKVVAFVGYSVAACLFGPTLGLLGSWGVGLLPTSALPRQWLTFWLGDLAGVLLVTPLILTMREPIFPGRRRGHALALLVGTVFVGELVFSRPFDWAFTGNIAALTFATFPIVIWAALAFGTAGASRTLLVVVALALWSTLEGQGPLASLGRNDALLVLQAFLGLNGITGLVLAAVNAERDRATAELRAARADLERRVIERTAGLQAAYAALEGEIAERTRAQEGRAEAEARLESAIESLPFDFWVCDAEGRYVIQNSVSRKHWGDQVGKVASEAQVNPDIARAWDANNRRALAGEIVTEVVEYEHEGRRRTYEKLLAPVWAHGQPIGVLGMNIDVTERKRLEQRLLQAERMEAVGRLAGGVAHDFNNLLTVILHVADLVTEELPDGHAAREPMAELRAAAGRAADLVRQLLTFARRQVTTPTRFAPAQRLRELEPLLARMLTRAISLRLELPPGDEPPWMVQIDPTQFDQVIVNLAVNARDAMPSGGSLTMRVQHATTGDGEVVIDVIDTGHGMDAATAAQVFEPFFTTKDAGRGVGLGLATCYGIVTQARGRIEVESAPGAGSRFRVVLPRSLEGPAAVVPRPAEQRPRGGGERILVVEDEPAVRAIAEVILRRAGYDVRVAGNGEEALAQLARDGRMDLLVSDVVMPGMSGKDLAERLRAERPSLRVLFMSGYAAVLEERDLSVGAGAGFLAKPFSAEELTRAVRSMLDQPARDVIATTVS